MEAGRRRREGEREGKIYGVGDKELLEIQLDKKYKVMGKEWFLILLTGKYDCFVPNNND